MRIRIPYELLLKSALDFFFRVILNSLDPVWNESYRIEVCHSAECLTFEVRDKDHAYAEFIGSVYIPVVGGLLVSWSTVGFFLIAVGDPVPFPTGGACCFSWVSRLGAYRDGSAYSWGCRTFGNKLGHFKDKYKLSSDSDRLKSCNHLNLS